MEPMTSAWKKTVCTSTPCMLSYSIVRNEVSLRKKHMQASRDLKQGEKFF
jgi:hypothetical protein